MRYYRLLDDLNNPTDRWFLKSLNVVDEKKISIWKFVLPGKAELSTAEKLSMSMRE